MQPFILEHLEAIADYLRDPRVFSFLHIPVQSGSDRWGCFIAPDLFDYRSFQDPCAFSYLRIPVQSGSDRWGCFITSNLFETHVLGPNVHVSLIHNGHIL